MSVDIEHFKKAESLRETILSISFRPSWCERFWFKVGPVQIDLPISQGPTRPLILTVEPELSDLLNAVLVTSTEPDSPSVSYCGGKWEVPRWIDDPDASLVFQIDEAEWTRLAVHKFRNAKGEIYIAN